MESTASERVLATIPRERLLRAGDPGYDEARQVWNGMIVHRPAIIARVESRGRRGRRRSRFAREHEAPVSIRGGGHNVAGLAVGDGGDRIDLSAMRAVTSIRRPRRAAAQGGATWGDFDAAAQADRPRDARRRRLETGMAGLTLGGGLGWLMRAHGLACDG